MDGRKIILLVGALIVAAITAFMARTLMLGAAAPSAEATIGGQPAPVSGKRVLVATRALPVGTILGPEAMKFQPWPEELIENAYHLEGAIDLKALQGTVVRFAIPAGQPISQGALVKPGDRGFLAAALAPGMRAITVPVSTQSSVAGFVFPGDRVDLILTQTVEGGGDGPPLKASETILRNIRVLATDQRADKQTDDKGNTVVTTYSTVTLEATPRIVEKISVAQTVGDLSLSLRSIADNSSELEEAIASGEVSMPEGDDPVAEKAAIARLAARPIEARGTSTTGADVSRFQRSSVPGKPKQDQLAAAPMGAAPYPGGAVAALPPRGPVVKIARANATEEFSIEGKK